MPRAHLSELKGGDPEHNARALREVLAGAKTPYRDIALLNAAGGLVVANRAATLGDGVALAARAIDDGSAAQTLERLVVASNLPEPAAARSA